jgi:hypothetical protein
MLDFGGKKITKTVSVDTLLTETFSVLGVIVWSTYVECLPPAYVPLKRNYRPIEKALNYWENLA